MHCSETFPSGCLTLDFALGGGLPRGRIVEVLTLCMSSGCPPWPPGGGGWGVWCWFSLGFSFNFPFFLHFYYFKKNALGLGYFASFKL